MKNKITQSIIAGLIGTVVMTGFILMAPMMGMPKMNPAEMISSMMGISVIVGYMMHFIIGIIFASVYVYLFNPNVNIENKFIKGGLYGFLVFAFAIMMMFIMSKLMPLPIPMENIMLTLIGGIMGHLVFGIMVALIVPANAIINASNNFLNSNA